MSDLPAVDLGELEADKRQNVRERLAFIRRYVEWLKKTPNSVWSAQQNQLLNKPPLSKN